MAEWKEQKGIQFWNPEHEKDELVGKCVKIDKDAEFGIRIVIEDVDRQQWMTPSHKVLQNRLMSIESGMMVKIVYLGEDSENKPKKGQNPLKLYKVFTM